LKALLIDLDGTLVDSLVVLYALYQRFMAERGLVGTVEEFMSLQGSSIEEAIARLHQIHQWPGQIEKTVQKYMWEASRYYKEQLELFPGTKDFLRRARENDYILAVVTSCHRELANSTLERLGIRDYFDVVLTADDVFHTKPHPELYQKALNELGLLPSEALAIEDTPQGIRSAQEAGIRAIWITHEEPRCALPQNIVARVKSWDELTVKKLATLF
jgi:HAD superfamily hydrolase (TIGR01509 family)